ncbi:divergent PAP2 family protein [Candidatus Saccharibacteria bacterium]|nr:divergent PAP2 family protein [Candidatus Saccharibacteria bacterium]NCU40356.1 divergent PAP2 family protein [Candidatus Saccharibacteria bacterium]
MKSSFAYLIAPSLAWLVAQSIKIILRFAKKEKSDFSKYFSSGDMPSAHTAVVTSLATVIFVNEGISDLFSISIWLAAITIYDALVARRSIGEQGSALLKLIEASPYAKDTLPRVALGHKPTEVIVGAILGVMIGLVVAFFITI